MVKVLKSNTDSDTSSEVKSATSKGASANDSMSANDNMGANNSKNAVEVESKDDRKARLKHLGTFNSKLARFCAYVAKISSNF